MAFQPFKGLFAETCIQLLHVFEALLPLVGRFVLSIKRSTFLSSDRAYPTSLKCREREHELWASLSQGLSVCSLRTRTRTENWRNDNAALPPPCLSINLSVEKTRLADGESHFNPDHSFGAVSCEESANLIITFLGSTSCSKRPRACVDRVFHVAYLPLSP